MRSVLSARFYNELWAIDAGHDPHDDEVDVPAWVKHERMVLHESTDEWIKRRSAKQNDDHNRVDL